MSSAAKDSKTTAPPAEEVVEIITPAAAANATASATASGNGAGNASTTPAATATTGGGGGGDSDPASAAAAAVAAGIAAKTPGEIAAEDEAKRKRLKKYVKNKQKQILDDIASDMKQQMAKLKDMRAAGKAGVKELEAEVARQRELELQYAKEVEAKHKADELADTVISDEELRFFTERGKKIPDDPKGIEQMLEGMPLFATKGTATPTLDQEAIDALIAECEPEERAATLKESGNEAFGHAKKYEKDQNKALMEQWRARQYAAAEAEAKAKPKADTKSPAVADTKSKSDTKMAAAKPTDSKTAAPKPAASTKTSGNGSGGSGSGSGSGGGGENEWREKAWQRYKDAEEYYNQAIDINCKDQFLNATLYANRAMVHIELGNYGKAIADCEVALSKPRADTIKGKAYYRAAVASKKLFKHAQALSYVKRGLDSPWKDSKEVKPLETLKLELEAIIEAEERRAREKEKRLKREAKQEMEKYQTLNTALVKKGISIGEPNFKYEQSMQYRSSIRVDPSDGQIHWPVLFLYDEYSQSDFIQDFTESHRFEQHIGQMFPPAVAYAPWDAKQKYRADNLRIYWEETDPTKPTQPPKKNFVYPQNTLLSVLTSKGYRVPGIPTFHLVPKK